MSAMDDHAMPDMTVATDDHIEPRHGVQRAIILDVASIFENHRLKSPRNDASGPT